MTGPLNKIVSNKKNDNIDQEAKEERITADIVNLPKKNTKSNRRHHAFNLPVFLAKKGCVGPLL